MVDHDKRSNMKLKSLDRKRNFFIIIHKYIYHYLIKIDYLNIGLWYVLRNFMGVRIIGGEFDFEQ